MSEPENNIQTNYQPVDIPQASFFDEEWKSEWTGMPEFVQEDMEPYATIMVRVASKEDLEELARLIGQNLTAKTKHIWHPKLTKSLYGTEYRYTDES